MLRLLVTAALAITALFATATMALSREWEAPGEMDAGWQIVFTTFSPGFGLVSHIMNLDGSHVESLGTREGNRTWSATFPDCSPDGNHLSFNDRQYFYITSSDGEDMHQVSLVRPGDEGALNIANDAEEGLFEGFARVNPVELEYGIYLIDITASKSRDLQAVLPILRIPASGGYDLSPDGRLIAFHTANEYRIHVVGIGDGVGIDLPQMSMDAIWSPDASMIVFTANWDGDFEIYVMDMNRSIIRQLTRHEQGSNYRTVAWSPDGRQIAFIDYASSQDGDLYIMNADGSGQHSITTPPTKVYTACFLTARPTSLIPSS
jgi:Tol biopolymer transport system component